MYLPNICCDRICLEKGTSLSMGKEYRLSKRRLLRVSCDESDVPGLKMRQESHRAKNDRFADETEHSKDDSMKVNQHPLLSILI